MKIETDRGIVFQKDSIEAPFKPAQIVLRKGEGLFREGTIGGALFPEILGGRSRPATTFDQPLTTFWRQGSKMQTDLKHSGLTTVADILFLRAQTLVALPQAAGITEKIGTYLEGLAITPHARLLEFTSGDTQSPVSPDREQEIIDVVNQAVATLPDRERRVVKLRYGLEDGITRKPAEVAAHSTLSADEKIVLSAGNVRDTEDKAGRLLRHPSRRLPLEQVTIVRDDSIAKAAFSHAILAKDVPQIPGRVLDFDWLEETRIFFQKFGSSWPQGDLSTLLSVKSELFPNQVADEIVAMAKSRIDENGIPKEAPPKRDMSTLYLEQRERRVRGHFQDMTAKVVEARNNGCTTVAEIRAWIETNSPELFRNEKNWVKDAMIEYVNSMEPS